MNSLHTVGSPQAMQACLPLLNQGDALLLLQNGVFAATADLLQSLPAGISVHALRDDLSARGLSQRLPAGITAVSYDDFVKLCCDYPKTISWF